ncbi:IclR family transcriptional regulator C-terminal domain-containing protein [Amycolatopsis sp. lyj-109]|uniref:IclR family transcriptional regulator domain-containing protein n=1 Tax=Amycolatopsis sp. lyj-109 TaxID=2789287 RepID=UPI00397D8853
MHTLPEPWAKIQESRRDGYARVREEFEEGLVGVSAPIRDFRGRVVAALNVSAPAAHLGWEARPKPPPTSRLTRAARSAPASAISVSRERR